MRKAIISLNAFLKGAIIAMRPHLFFGWLKRPLMMSSNMISLSSWLAKQEKKNIPNDFYSPTRDYSKRFRLYELLADSLQLKDAPFEYLEFGVSGGQSFKWWLENCKNTDSRFFGFDTFEGLPEDWGTFQKGEMSADVPKTNDPRAEFIKGLFQDTLPGFLAAGKIQPGTKKIIHLDADLFSATLFALGSLSPFLKKGDILVFDEFNVPNHEFAAFKIFCESYYREAKLIGAMNNYLQVAMVIEK